MTAFDTVPMVRCRLDSRDEDPVRALRYVPLDEFGLWRYLMEHRHGRQVTVEEISIWVAEESARWNSFEGPESLEPVLRAIGIELPPAPGDRMTRASQRFVRLAIYIFGATLVAAAGILLAVLCMRLLLKR